jgi:catechol 2,3-dioxygenase-like lactoylglutathione lyase family enzyme
VIREARRSANGHDAQAMTATLNHVSVNARDLDESIAFYVDVLGAEPLPSPNFGIPVRWLALGRTQLHLFQRDLEPSPQHHFAVGVDEIEPIYRAGQRRDAFEHETFGHHLIELPGDMVQLYLRDPVGNLLEVDCPGVDRLPADIRAQLRPLWDLHPQSEENLRGRLFVPA